MDDLIRRKTVLMHISDWQLSEAKEGNEILYNTLEQCIQGIESEPAFNPWIPVSKGLPDITVIGECGESIMHESDVCIVTTKEKRVTCAVFSYDAYKDSVTASDCWIEEVTDRALDVVAWMPLPEPYEE